MGIDQRLFTAQENITPRKLRVTRTLAGALRSLSATRTYRHPPASQRPLTSPPRGAKWTRGSVYNLRCRFGWHTPKPNNQRAHSDEEVKARLNELKTKGHTYQAVANILNEEGYKPLCGAKFTRNGVLLLLRGIKTQVILTPRAFAEQYIAQCDEKPSLATIAAALKKNAYQTPRGNTNWWPAQVRERLAGRFDEYYNARSSTGSAIDAR